MACNDIGPANMSIVPAKNGYIVHYRYEAYVFVKIKDALKFIEEKLAASVQG